MAKVRINRSGMKVIKEIADECFEAVAIHYADKIRESCSGITEEQIRKDVTLHWDTISEEVADLYATVVVMLEDSEIQF